MKRYALITLSRESDTIETVKRYLPDNYRVIYSERHSEWSSNRQWTSVVIAGRDVAGWTLDGYVLPRLASGLIGGHEIDLSDEIMKRVPDTKRFRWGELVVVSEGPSRGMYLGIVKELDNEEVGVLAYTWGQAEGELMRFWADQLRAATPDEQEAFQDIYLKRPPQLPENAEWRELPYSEVCMHMRVAGLHMWVAPVGSNMAQLYDVAGLPFSAPITCGEAGIPYDSERQVQS